MQNKISFVFERTNFRYVDLYHFPSKEKKLFILISRICEAGCSTQLGNTYSMVQFNGRKERQRDSTVALQQDVHTSITTFAMKKGTTLTQEEKLKILRSLQVERM